MAGTVVAVFDTNQQAERAAQALLDAGVLLNDIALVNKNAGGETGGPHLTGNDPEHMDEEFTSNAVRAVPTHDVEQPISPMDEMLPRAVVGMVTGISVGALVVAVSVFFPNIYHWVEHSPLIAEAIGGVIGGLVGAAIGALTAGGIPEESARAYHHHVEGGKTLVTALVSQKDTEELQNILRSNGGHDVGFFTRFLDSVQSFES